MHRGQKRTVALAALAAGTVAAGGVAALLIRRKARIRANAPEVVPHVDLQRYAGQWFEIARFPNRFERGCVDPSATYTLREDGTMSVVNECHLKKHAGKHACFSGKARVVDPATNARLKVSFRWPFTGDYWIIDLGENYEYAVVSDPRRKFLWILSRMPEMDADQYQAILARLREKGYNTDKLIQRQQAA